MNYLALLVGAVAAGSVSPAFGHVRLNSPNGGEQLTVGESFTIEWRVVIAHNTLNWDVFYSTETNGGPWTTISLDLPPGDTSINSIHTYEWTVPNDLAEDAWVRVVMDNSGADYQDVSDASFAIVPAPGVLAMFGCGALIGAGRRRRR